MPLPHDLAIESVCLTPGKMREAGHRLFGAPVLGVRREDAETVTEELLKAEMAGYPSHGFSRFRRYLDYIRAGSIDPRAEIDVEFTDHFVTILPYLIRSWLFFPRPFQQILHGLGCLFLKTKYYM